MADLVTKAQAFNHLRFDTDPVTGPDAEWLDIWIPVVSEAVIGWLKDLWRVYVTEVDADGQNVLDSNGDPIILIDSNGDMTPRRRVVGAVLLELESMNRFRDGGGKDNVVPSDAGWGYGLNKASTALLSSLRKSTVA